MESNYQHKKDNINDKIKLRNLKRKNERPGINNQNRGYLNNFKSKASYKIVRSQSEPNINPRNENENISLEKKLKMDFLKLKR